MGTLFIFIFYNVHVVLVYWVMHLVLGGLLAFISFNQFIEAMYLIYV